MDHNLDSHVRESPGHQRQEIHPKTAKKSLTKSRNSSQQPGRYLCVDTRKDQVVEPKIRPNSSYTHNFSSPNTRSKHFSKDVQENLQTKKNLKTIQNRTVQPDSHCKFKTTLAIKYVQDILEENATNCRPVRHPKSLKKTGQMKQLLNSGQPAMEPNVTKCLGIQNDRQKKTVTLDDGHEIREEVITPDIARFSSAVKHSSQNTLTVDLRKLSLADQTETLTSDDSTMFGECQENDPDCFVKNKKGVLIYHKNSDLSEFEYSKNNDNRYGSDFSRHPAIDDDDENINDVDNDQDDYRLNYNRHNQDMDITDHTDDFRDCRSVKHQVKLDHLDSIDDTIVSNDHIHDGIADYDDDLVPDEEKTIDGENALANENLYETELLSDKNGKSRSDDRSKINYECNQEDFNDKEDLESYYIPGIPERDKKTCKENEESDLKHENIQEPRQNLDGNKPLPDSGDLTTSLLKQGSPDQDSIQVKDIWKALVDGGYEISREEVSKYKVNSTKPRIKSAPARRRSPRCVRKDVPIRARSAIHRDGGSRKEYLEDFDAKTHVGQTEMNSKVGSFKQTRIGSENTLKQSQRNDDKSLEVVAVSKPVTKLHRKKSIPLVPPLNFQINTIPKSGHFFYFAYGLNMNKKRLEIQLKCQTGDQYWGLLLGFKLLFNKKGSAQGATGFPNIVHEPGFSVEGCVYELSLDCLPLLDTCVGFPKHYSRLVIPVWLCNSLNVSEHGVAQHCVPAVVYVAQDEWICSDPATLDTSFTLKQVVLGTDLLTSNYHTYLDSLKQRATDRNEKFK